MKLKLLIALAILILSANLNAQETQNSSESPEIGKLKTEFEWKSRHEERMKIYGQVAESLNDANKIPEANPLAEAIKKSAAKLPATSFHARNLRNLAASLTKLKSSVETKLDLATIDEAKMDLKEISKQLAFRPTLESEMPVGFPAPTPVGEIEMKSYPKYRLARTEVEGEPMDGKGAQSFFRLFNHIQSNDIAMTAPVEMTYKQSESGVSESTMAFLYRNTGIGQTGQEGEIKIVDAPPKKVISMGLRGRPSKAQIEKAVEQIRSHSLTLAAKFELSREVVVMGYNGPSVPVENQFYEVQLEVKKKPVKVKA